MKYAIVRIKGHQYKVKEGDELLVDHIAEKDVTPEVLLISDEGKVTVGKPVIEKAKISTKIVEDLVKGDKVVAFKYKAKSRYRKTRGFRHSYSKLQIGKITA